MSDQPDESSDLKPKFEWLDEIHAGDSEVTNQGDHKENLPPTQIPASDEGNKFVAFFTEELREKKLKNDELQNIIDFRKILGFRLFWLSCAWIAAILVIVLLAGFGGIRFFVFYLPMLSPVIRFESSQFHLSDAVLISLICTTTATVIGLLYVVVRYLFPSPTDSQKKS